MVKVADIDPVGDDSFAADLHIKVALHCVVSAEDSLVADPKSSFVGINEVAFTEMHPPTNDEAPVALPCLQRHVFADKDEALGDHLWVAKPQPQESAVALQIPEIPGPIREDPPQAGQREVPRLAGI